MLERLTDWAKSPNRYSFKAQGVNADNRSNGPLRYEDFGEAFRAAFANDGKIASPSVRVAVQHATVYRCAEVRASSIARSRWEIKPEKPGRDRLLRLLNVEPTPLMSGNEYWEWVVNGMDFHGNSVSIIVKDFFGNVVQLIPVPWSDVTVRVTGGKSTIDSTNAGGRLVYRLNSSGITYDQRDILHFKGALSNGVEGVSIIKAGGHNAIAMQQAMDAFAWKFFVGGAQQRFALKPGAAGAKSQQKRDQAAKNFKEKYSRGNDSGDLIVLSENDSELIEIGVNPEDSQLLQARGDGVLDITRAWGVPPQYVNITQGVTTSGSTMVEMNQTFREGTLGTIFSRLEAEVDRKLLRNTGALSSHNTDWLTRGTRMMRAQRHRLELAGMPWTLIDEVREEEGLDPLTDEEREMMVEQMAMMRGAPGMPEDGGSGAAPNEDPNNAGADDDGNPPNNVRRMPTGAN